MTSKAGEVSRNRRLATCTVDIIDETGDVIAVLQGLACAKNDPLPALKE
jgi:hypothetical protein